MPPGTRDPGGVWSLDSLKTTTLTCSVVIAIVLVFSAWRIWQTSVWLNDHRAYIRARDARWEPFLTEIENHLRRQDGMVEKVESGQNIILEAVKKSR